MDESRIHGLHRIGEVLEALYPELITPINQKTYGIFQGSRETLEIGNGSMQG